MTDETRPNPERIGPGRLYRYGLAGLSALFAGNYAAWMLNFIDYRCIVVAMVMAVFVLVVTDA